MLDTAKLIKAPIEDTLDILVSQCQESMKAERTLIVARFTWKFIIVFAISLREDESCDTTSSCCQSFFLHTSNGQNSSRECQFSYIGRNKFEIRVSILLHWKEQIWDNW